MQNGGPPAPAPVLIIGAGISGLLLAQHLREVGVPFRIFERDADLTTRGVGWGLTLHWCLPAMRALLPASLVVRIPEAYVDRWAVGEGKPSTFPFFDLKTGELVAATPPAGEDRRIRVTREKLRQLLAYEIDIEWGKTFASFESKEDSVTVTFQDGSSCTGSLLVGCDGTHSRIRRALFPEQGASHRLPIRLLGLKVQKSPEESKAIRDLDPYFLQGASSENDSFIYFSVLDAPGNYPFKDTYSIQMVTSWPVRPGFLGREEPLPFPDTNAGRLELIRSFANTWADPFRSFALSLPDDTEVATLELYDWPPPKGLRSQGRVVIMGDALHAMAMYRGEGANHAIVDVQDFTDAVVPALLAGAISDHAGLRIALDAYEDRAVARARPGVLASRRACLDAHDWRRIGPESPLLTRRQMHLEFDEEVPTEY